MGIDPPFKGVKTFCWPTLKICEEYHEKIKKDRKNYGKPSSCATSEIAYCYYLEEHKAMSRQMRCARTPEDCQVRRQQTIDEPVSKTIQSSVCERALNIETFIYKPIDNEPSPVPVPVPVP